MGKDDNVDVVCGLFAILTGELEDAITPAFQGQRPQPAGEALARAQLVLAASDRMTVLARAILVLVT